MRQAKFPFRTMRLLSALLDAQSPLKLGDIRKTVEDYAQSDESDETVKKRLQRDRKLLESAGIVVDTDKGYQIQAQRSFVRSLPLNDEERLALLFLENQLPDDPALASAFAKLNALVDWPEHLRDHAQNHYRFSHPHSVDQTVRLCSEALASSRCLKVSYQDAQGQATGRIIEPLQMAYAKGSWYCLAWCRLRKDFRGFNCHRMDQVEVLDEKVNPHHEEVKDQEALFDKFGIPPFLYGQGEEKLVQVQVGAEVAFMVQDKNWPVLWEEQSDGTLKGEIPTRDIAGLFTALLPFMAHLKIEGPEDFKQYCRQRFASLEEKL